MPVKKSPHNLPIRVRFERFFVKGLPDECWRWNGSLNKKGYGDFRIGAKKAKAHRVSYSLYKGEIPAGMQVLHNCDNASCVNPSHLTCGTDLNNQRDAWIRDRKKAVRKLSKDDVENIRSSTDPQRVLAKRYHVHPSEICRVRSGKRGDGILLMGTDN